MSITISQITGVFGLIAVLGSGFYGYGILNEKVNHVENELELNAEEQLRQWARINNNEQKVLIIESNNATLAAILGRVEADVRSVKDDIRATNELLREAILDGNRQD